MPEQGVPMDSWQSPWPRLALQHELQGLRGSLDSARHTPPVGLCPQRCRDPPLGVAVEAQVLQVERKRPPSRL
jgi:hypothetical protein